MSRQIVVFDAMCVLCSGNAQFILKHDKKHRFDLASMQGEVGAGIYRRYGIDPNDPETMVVLDGEELYRDSDAVIAIAEGLGWPWKAAAALRVTPKAWRNAAYAVLARNRYRWFGRRETCWLPDPAMKDRVLP